MNFWLKRYMSVEGTDEVGPDLALRILYLGMALGF